MDRNVLKYCLTDYDAWERRQNDLDNFFANAKLTKREYILASLELMIQHTPKGEGLNSHSGKYK